mmetsp:Transcript_8795/g.6535  ORF Transcript_8795/g.6535 Transcript_8795/m.6535 type:complete len:144 (+) Transcript_8795:1048-1479(+)
MAAYNEQAWLEFQQQHMEEDQPMSDGKEWVQEMSPVPQTQLFQQHCQEQLPAEDEDDDLEQDRMEAEELILNAHLECVKEEAQLITQEGELITKVEKAMIHEADYDMRGYLQTAEAIAHKKLKMYKELIEKIADFKETFEPQY